MYFVVHVDVQKLELMVGLRQVYQIIYQVIKCK